nr:MAG TPA: hypothetical protein [Caudoviricetes sp.]
MTPETSSPASVSWIVIPSAPSEWERSSTPLACSWSRWNATIS